MEFASRGSVEEAIKRCRADCSPFAELTVRSWLQQLSGALHHMHSKQMLYRDLKPANVLIDEHGHLRVVDMGMVATRSP